MLDSIRYQAQWFDGREELMDSINTNIYRKLEGLVTGNRYQRVDLTYGNKFSYLLSPDKKFCLASWDTELGGTMIAFASVAIYQTNTGTAVRRLADTLNVPSAFYTDLYSLNDTDGTPTYFAYGYGRGSTILPYRTLRAFRTDNELVDTLRVFNDRSNTLFYDMSHFTEQDSVTNIDFPSDRRTIRVPVLSDEGVATGQWDTYSFNGQVYQKKN